MSKSRHLWFELVSPDVLISFMGHRDETVRSLAAKCVVKDAAGSKALHPSFIGHLRSGAKKTCRPETAKAIERALDAPPGLLFVPQVLARYTRAEHQARRDQAAA
jgi:hypothetical protein